ncbi:MAG: MBOAT family protein [Chlorobi bacterium]|nr:MBOAT family protein [Chlorobiota bacterium]
MDELINILKSQNEALFLFTNTAFWIFFGLVLLGHAFVYRYKSLRIVFLFLVSLFFYYKTGGYFFSLLLFSTITDYFIGLGLGKYEKKAIRKLLLITSLVLNLSLLAYFKYLFFFVDLINKFFDAGITPVDYLAEFGNRIFNASFDISTITLPVGISFFTFQTLSYSIDVYRRKIEPVKNIIDFGFYVSFFPQLVAGPIVRASQFIPQLMKPFHVSERAVWKAILLILGGLFKKMVISDYLSVNLVDRVFETPDMYSGVEILTAIYGYALQIYCDFSGYTDIAIGLALLLGFKLPRNFNSPYKATSIVSFWRRWHMSLSFWLRDYLYIPLGGNRKGTVRTGINIMITMLLGGLWHGANIRFVIWGLLHGAGLVINKLISAVTAKLRVSVPKWLGWIVTFQFVVITWVIFRAHSLETIHVMGYRILNAFQPGLFIQFVKTNPYIFGYIILGYFIHWLPGNMKKRVKKSFYKSPVVIKILISALILYLIHVFHQADLQPFIYFRF